MKYIFEVRIKPGHTVEEYVQAWEKGSAVIQASPGAQGTQLHHKIGESDVLLAIATWESKEARDVAMKKLDQADAKTKSILDKHKEYGDITVIGAFEEAEWKVAGTSDYEE